MLGCLPPNSFNTLLEIHQGSYISVERGRRTQGDATREALTRHTCHPRPLATGVVGYHPTREPARSVLVACQCGCGQASSKYEVGSPSRALVKAGHARWRSRAASLPQGLAPGDFARQRAEGVEKETPVPGAHSSCTRCRGLAVDAIHWSYRRRCGAIAGSSTQDGGPKPRQRARKAWKRRHH
jgi:hypothetical protein